VDYLSINDDSTVEFKDSRKRLSELVEPKRPPADYEILMDFRRTQWVLTTYEIYTLVQVLVDKPDSFRDKIALLLLPGVNFDREYFEKLCADNKDITIRTFTNYEDAIQWFYKG
jgi:hypothetical protein